MEMFDPDNLYYPDTVTGLAKKVITLGEYLFFYRGSLPLKIEIIDGWVISTIFLAFDINGGQGTRILTFETRVFMEKDGPQLPYWRWAYATPEEAFIGHEAARQMHLNGEFKTPIAQEEPIPSPSCDTPQPE